MPTRAYATQAPAGLAVPHSITRRQPTPTDVAIDIMYCGVCHSDLHQAKGEWPGTQFPCVPGHEILGRVSAVGPAVKKFKVGDLAAVGCMVDSCRSCANCKNHQEQFCIGGGATFTYNSADKHLGGHTFGGYSEHVVVDEAFTLKVPANLDPAAAAPLLCAGITTYSPLRHWGATKGKKVGIIGLGGLGHMGVKFSKAFGAHTVLFTTSESKVEDGKRLGADEVVISKNMRAMMQQAGSFDLLIDTVSADHDLNAYLGLLKLDGTLAIVGVPPNPQPVHAFSLILPRRNLSGSLIGGIAETQEMLDFCGKHNIACDIELIKIQQINEAWERIVKSDVKYRFVIDMASIKA